MLAILSVLQLLAVKHDNERSSQTHWSMTTAVDIVNDNISLMFFPLFSHYDELLKKNKNRVATDNFINQIKLQVKKFPEREVTSSNFLFHCGKSINEFKHFMTIKDK